LLSQLQLIPQPLQKIIEVAIDLKMADKKIYQASTTAPVNIAVVKYEPLPHISLSLLTFVGIGENETQNSTSQPIPLSQ
jgi:hypothetical protein